MNAEDECMMWNEDAKECRRYRDAKGVRGERNEESLDLETLKCICGELLESWDSKMQRRGVCGKRYEEFRGDRQIV